MVQNSKAVGFSAKVEIVNIAANRSIRRQATPYNPILRPLIKHLKHNCGGNDNEFIILVGNEITSLIGGNLQATKDIFVRGKEIKTPKGFEKKHITQMIKFAQKFMRELRGIKKSRKETVAS